MEEERGIGKEMSPGKNEMEGREGLWRLGIGLLNKQYY